MVLLEHYHTEYHYVKITCQSIMHMVELPLNGGLHAEILCNNVVVVSSLKSLDQISKLLSAQIRVGTAQLCTSKRPLSIQARYSNVERSSNMSTFVDGFKFGGLIIGTLGCIDAPQVPEVEQETKESSLKEECTISATKTHLHEEQCGTP
ncbi:hypothetical protein Tco_0260181 [Tanacetum coccineum]